MGISGHGGLNGGSCHRGGGGTISTIGGMVLPTRGGSGSVTGCTIAPPPSPSFPIPSMMEPLFKRLKVMVSQLPSL